MMKKTLRGVNLGGWLVLERWMTPSLFTDLKAEDETHFCLELGDGAEAKLRHHWETFITSEDIQWLHQIGINAVRIPVGYWLFGGVQPYIGASDVLDRMMSELQQNQIQVVLDFHAAPGCQNGEGHGGLQGVCEWHQSEEYIARSLDFLEQLADHYQHYDNLYAIELLNEPRWDIPRELLKEYYIQGYLRIRKHMSPQQVAIAIPDSLWPPHWDDFMKEPEFSNVLVDTHLYQCFTPDMAPLGIGDHLQIAIARRQQEIADFEQQFWTIVGEWSLGLPPGAFQEQDEFSKNLSIRAYGAAQLMSYERCRGWFFWSYKLEPGIGSGWNFRECVERGWLPASYGY